MAVTLGAIRLAIAIALSAMVAPLAGEAQQGTKSYRIGYLSAADRLGVDEPFHRALRELGYTDGQNITIENRFAGGDAERLREAAFELVRLNVDIIVTRGPQATRAVKVATSRIPVVMAFDSDPVGMGFVANLARPGGNITGLSTLAPELDGKRLELLKEMLPPLRRVAILWNPAQPGVRVSLRETESAARTLGIQVVSLEIHAQSDLKSAVEGAKHGRAEALIVLRDPVTSLARTTMVRLAAEYRLPTMYWDEQFVAVGGLLAYGPSAYDLYRRAAVYVDKILKGAKPADLPVEQPTKFDLVINMKTAKALALTIPPSLLARADRVIQ
jgi:putative tryptophan/tyrosine transport system substrate-binding protein